MDNIILSPPKKGREKIVAAQLATILATHWTGNILSFMDSPSPLISPCTKNTERINGNICQMCAK